MKKIIVFQTLLLCLLSCSSSKGQTGPPSVVVNAFEQRFPNARDVEWSHDGRSYVVEFETFLKDHEAWFGADGSLTRYRRDASRSELTPEILEALRRDYAAFRIEEVDRIEENGQTTFEVELDGRPEDLILVDDGRGKVILTRQE